MGGRQWDFRNKLGLHVVVDSMNTYTLVVDSMSRHWLDWAWRMPGVEGGASLGQQVRRVEWDVGDAGSGGGGWRRRVAEWTSQQGKGRAAQWCEV